MTVYLRNQPNPLLIPWLPVNTTLSWTNQPAAVTVFNSFAYAHPIDLRSFSQARVSVTIITVAGFAGATLTGQWSPDNAAWINITNPIAIDAIATVPGVWLTIPIAAQISEGYLRIVGAGGNAATTPQFRALSYSFK